MEIDITTFVKDENPFDFSASVFERGENAGEETWDNAKDLAGKTTLLRTDEEKEAFRNHIREFGAWDREEIWGWDDVELNALFIQLISGDMREAGMDEVDIEDFDWEEYEEQSQAGQISGNMFESDGKIYYQLSY